LESIDLSTVSTVLLAGGQSRRMGEHKALLDVNGRSLLDNLVQSLTEYGCLDIIVAGEPEPSLYGARYNVVEDAYKFEGPVAGIHAGLKAAKNDAVLVLPCDILAAPKSAIARLLTAFNACEHSVCARDSKRLQPLFAIYKRSDFQIAEQVLQQGQRRMIALIDAAGVEVIDCSDLTDAFENINTPQEYRAAIQKNQEHS